MVSMVKRQKTAGLALVSLWQLAPEQRRLLNWMQRQPHGVVTLADAARFLHKSRREARAVLATQVAVGFVREAAERHSFRICLAPRRGNRAHRCSPGLD